MLSKEECEKALDHSIKWVNADNLDDMVVFRKLIDEHFELVENIKTSELNNEKFYIAILESRIKELEYLLNNKESELLKIEVYDKDSKTKHVVGTNAHDCLLVENGKVVYYNLQNGESTGPYGDYEFVEKRLFDD